MRGIKSCGLGDWIMVARKLLTAEEERSADGSQKLAAERCMTAVYTPDRIMLALGR
jgi:hypothetical protein